MSFNSAARSLFTGPLFGAPLFQAKNSVSATVLVSHVLGGKLTSSSHGHRKRLGFHPDKDRRRSSRVANGHQLAWSLGVNIGVESVINTMGDCGLTLTSASSREMKDVGGWRGDMLCGVGGARMMTCLPIDPVMSWSEVTD